MKNIITDHELVARYLKGDEKSFELLVSRYMNVIYRFVLTYVRSPQIAEDITQEVFLKVWRNAKKIDKSKNFKSWIYTIAKHTAFDFLKKKKSIPFSHFADQNGKNYVTERLVDPQHLPDKLSQSLEDKSEFLGAIEKLPLKYKLTLSLYYYQYLNFREIAELLKESINTIKSRHRRGLALLKKILGEPKHVSLS